MKTNKILIGSVILLLVLNIIQLTPLFLKGPKHGRGHEYPPMKCAQMKGHPFGEPNCRKGMRGGYGKMEFILHEKLGLNEEQISQFKDYRKEQKSYMKDQRRALSDNADAKKETLAKIEVVQQEIRTKRYEHLEKVLSLVEDDKKPEAKRFLLKIMSPKPHRHYGHKGGRFCAR